MPRRILSNDLNAANDSLEGVNVRSMITLCKRHSRPSWQRDPAECAKPGPKDLLRVAGALSE